jgi:hypothetical protein
MALTYGAAMRLPPEPAGAAQRRARLLEAAAAMRDGVAAAQAIISGGAGERGGAAMRLEVGAERDLWEYSAETLEGLAQWLQARTLTGAERRATGARAIEKIERAVRHVREIDPALKGTWGAYDMERLHGIWTERLKRSLDE